ncbi:hypothetical protein OSB04_020231 [Centaurea solstitialis]|uniref:Uncharacterized protein n=1 Tax=Centaurea solstitialis TaxID=347529 RepID=A0AA38TBD7_9ASTR|nr:hypothetical protein OSB04_020231 [Centaurea solstitialis]
MFEMYRSRTLIILKNVLKMSPSTLGRSIWFQDGVQKIGGYSTIYPLENNSIKSLPESVIHILVSRRNDMIQYLKSSSVNGIESAHANLHGYKSFGAPENEENDPERSMKSHIKRWKNLPARIENCYVLCELKPNGPEKHAKHGNCTRHARDLVHLPRLELRIPRKIRNNPTENEPGIGPPKIQEEILLQYPSGTGGRDECWVGDGCLLPLISCFKRGRFKGIPQKMEIKNTLVALNIDTTNWALKPYNQELLPSRALGA